MCALLSLKETGGFVIINAGVFGLKKCLQKTVDFFSLCGSINIVHYKSARRIKNDKQKPLKQSDK